MKLRCDWNKGLDAACALDTKHNMTLVVRSDGRGAFHVSVAIHCATKSNIGSVYNTCFTTWEDAMRMAEEMAERNYSAPLPVAC